MDYEEVESTWKWQDADWDKFQSLLKTADINIPHIIYQKDCDQLLTKYYKLIYRAMKQTIPRSQPKIIDKNSPWWTPQLRQQRKTVSKLYRTATRFPSERNKNRYRTAQKRYAKECDKTRDRSWSDFKEKLDSIEAVNQFRKIIEKHINIKIGTLVKTNGEITDPGEDTITHLLSVHFPSATTKEKTQYNPNKYITKTCLLYTSDAADE